MSGILGRDDELIQLRALLGQEALVTVTGPPGVGKTRLARVLADEAPAQLGMPALWCDLGTVGESLAASDAGAAFAQHLGVGSLETLVTTLEGRPHLLVLDSCDLGPLSASDVVEELRALCPTARILTTGRRPLGLADEYVWVLPPLAVPSDLDHVQDLTANPGVRLYLTRSMSAGAGEVADPDQLRVVARLVRELDGLPLGIELAGARARSLGPGDLLRRTDQQLDLLREARRAPPSRASSLRASIELSYRQLDPDEQAMFRCFSVFRGPVAADLVHSVCAAEGSDELDTADLLSSLVDCSLLHAEPGAGGVIRYRLLNVVRRFAQDQLVAEGGLDDVEERCIDRLATMADAFVAGASEGWTDELVARMLGCFPTLVGAIELALRRDADAARAIRLYLPLYSAVHERHPTEVAALGVAMEQTWSDQGEPLRAEAECVLSAAHLIAGDPDAAVELARRVQGRTEASPLALLLAGRTLAFAAFYRGETETALQHLEEAIALARDWGGPFELDLVVADAAMRAAHGDPDDALVAELGALVEQCATAGEALNQMSALAVLGPLLVRAGRLAHAEAVAREARDLAERLDQPWGASAGLRVLAAVHAQRGGWESSRPSWADALDVSVAAFDRGAVAATIDQAAGAAAALGEPDAAQALAEARLRGWAPSVQPDMFPVPSIGEVGTASMAEAVRRARSVLSPGSASTGDPDQGTSVSLPPARDDEGEQRRPLASAPEPDAGPALVRRGEVWTASFEGRSTTVRHAKGLDDLARLLEAPEQEIHCLDLMDAAVVESDTGANLDTTARASYEQRIRELQADLEEAAANHDVGREEVVATELDDLVDELTRATARGGRDRPTNSTVERARAAVRWRVRAAIERLADQDDDLGRHLQASVRTGVWCSYRPERRVDWHVER